MNFSVGARYKKLQRLSLAVIGGFLFFLIAIVAVRSTGRKSLLEGGVQRAELEEQIAAQTQTSSALHLQEFHRTEVKDGKPIWEIRARDAKYFAGEELAQVNDAEITIFRERGSSVKLQARAGKLSLDGQALRRADFEGNVRVSVDDSMTLLTDFASYDSKTRLVQAPGDVRITGPGYQIDGVELRFHVDSRELALERNVRSQFQRSPGSSTDGIKSVLQESS